MVAKHEFLAELVAILNAPKHWLAGFAQFFGVDEREWSQV